MSEERLKIEKIQKSSKRAFIITNVTKVFCIVMAIAVLITGFVLLAMRKPIEKSLSICIENGVLTREELMEVTADFEITFGRNLSPEGSFIETVGAYVIVVGAELICFAIVMHFIGKALQGISKSYSPFQPEIVKNLKVTFVLMTLLALKSSLLIGAVMGFSLWCAIYILEYGCVLQKQSDETL